MAGSSLFDCGVILLRLLAVLSCFLLWSCIDGREELWLNADGSGAAEVSYEIPSSAILLGGGEDEIRHSILESIAKNPGLKLDRMEFVSQQDSRVRIEVRVTFESALKLVDLSKPDSTSKMSPTAQKLAGTFDFRLQGRDFELHRTIEANRAFAGGLFMPNREIRGRRLKYILHLPQAPLDSNATQVEDGGKTLIWDFSLEEALKAPLVTRVKARIPIPWWLVTGGIGVFALMAWGGWRWKPWKYVTSLFASRPKTSV